MPDLKRFSWLPLLLLLLTACSIVAPPSPPPADTGISETSTTAPPNPRKEHRRNLLDAALAGLTVDGDRVRIAEDRSGAATDGLSLATEARRMAAEGYSLEAIALFVDALALSTDDAGLYFDLARQLEREKRVDTAIAVLRTGLDYAPEHLDARRHLAGLLQAEGELQLAEEALRLALSSAPDDGKAHAHLAILAQRNGDRDAAKHHLERAEAVGVAVPAQLRALLDPSLQPPEKTSGLSSLGSNIGPQVRVDNGTGQLNESSASSSALRPLEVVSAWHTYDEPDTIRIAAGISLNEGATWNRQLIRPPLAFRGDFEGDPMTAVDPRTGNSWAGGITFNSTQSHLFAARRTPGGSSFGTPSMIRTNTNLDKALMAAGPRPGLPQTTRLYVAYTTFGPFAANLQFSDNLGSTWSAATTLPEEGTGLLPRVGPNGELYIAYWDGSLSFPSNIRLARSFNGGASFSTAQVAQRLDWWNTNTTSRLPGTFRTPVLPYLAVNPVNGHLYVVYFDTTNTVGGNSNVDLYFTRSTNQGANWSTPTPILTANPPADQFFPWIEVDATGRLHLLFWDTRNVTQNDSSNNPTAWLDVYYAVSNDDGNTWTESRLTPNSFDADLGQVFGTGNPRFLGDYSSLAVSDDVAHPVYLSTQNGDADLFTHRIEAAQPPDARDDFYATFRNQSLDIFFNDLLINDVSLSGGTLSVCGNTNPNQGTLIPFTGGATYAPPVGFTGEDSLAVTVCDSNGGQVNTTLFIEVLPGSVAFSDDFENGIGKGWTPSMNQGSYVIASAAAALQGVQGMEVGVAGVGARAFLENDVKPINNYHAIYQLDPRNMFVATGDVHAVLRGFDAGGQHLFEIQVDRPSAFGPHRLPARLRASNGVWSATAWTTIDRPVAVNVRWNAGPSLPFSAASLSLKVDGQTLPVLTAVNGNSLTRVRLGINDVIDPQTQGNYRFDSYYGSSVLLR